MLKQLDGSLSVSIALDSWLGDSPLANYQPIEPRACRLIVKYLSAYRRLFGDVFRERYLY